LKKKIIHPGAKERSRRLLRRWVGKLTYSGQWFPAAIVVCTVGLALTVLALSLPLVWDQTYSFFSSPLQQAMLALTALLLLFSSYVLYQQKLIKRIRGQLDEETAERTRLQTAVEEFHQLTLLDPLTGLYNRHFLEQHLAAEMSRCQRHDYSLNVLKVDLHHFRQINTHYGPGAGDIVLKTFSECLRKSVRNSDLSVRTGSDEFLVLLPESTPERVPHILTRLSGVEVEFRGEKIPIKFAAGWTTYQPGEKPQELLARVDEEVAADKQTGRAEEAIRQAQADLRQMQTVEAMGRLAGRVAHDFNNLLNLVKGYSELVLDSLGGSDPLRQYIEQIHDANERASSLTRQLLAFNRSQDANRELMDLNLQVGGMETMLRRLVGDQIELVIAMGEEPGWIQGNRGQLEQIVLELSVNARETMPKGGRLTIETRNVELDEAFVHWHPGARPGSYVLLAVLDTGTGIGPQEREHIFEPFPSQKDKGKKSGMGLASVYGIVKQSGGYVWVDSEPGLGTRFTIYLPRVEKPVGVL
jgi:diguanylate cyclase (GGDEF)-like protein